MEGVKEIGGNKSMSYHPTLRLDPPKMKGKMKGKLKRPENIHTLWMAMLDKAESMVLLSPNSNPNPNPNLAKP